MPTTNVRILRAPRGSALTARSWQTEAPLRMLLNNLDPEVAERPEELVVYGGSGKAARNWGCLDAILAALTRLGPEETLLIQSGKPVGILPSHADAPRVLIANSNLVAHWATPEHFDALLPQRFDERLNLQMCPLQFAFEGRDADFGIGSDGHEEARL